MSDSQQKSLKNKILNAGVWIFLGHFASQALSFGSNLISTRILVPEVFGILALAYTFIYGLNLMSDLGIRQSIIQNKQGETEAFLNSAWTMQVMRGVLIAILGLSISLAIYLFSDLWPKGSTYRSELLPYVLGCISFTALIDALQSTNIAIADRHLNSKKLVTIDFISQVTGLSVLMIWLFTSPSIWAMVAGAFGTSITKLLLSHFYLKGTRNKFLWNKAIFIEIFHFGKWIFLTSILGFLCVSGDRLILSNLVSAKQLGIYSIAVLIFTSAHGVFSKVITSVVFPGISEVIRNDVSQLKAKFYKVRFIFDAASLTITGFLFFSSEFIISLLYDDRYLYAGYALKVLSLALIQVRYDVTSYTMMAMGKPNAAVPLSICRAVLLFVLLPFMHSSWGMDGAVWAISISVLSTIPFAIHLMVKHNFFDLKRELIVLPFILLGMVIGKGFTFLGQQLI